MSSRLVKELRAAYAHLGISTEVDLINYLQFVMILQFMNYVNKRKASDEENQLLVDAWNSLKTRSYQNIESGQSKEGITFANLNTFIHVINHMFPKDFSKIGDKAESELYESRPFGQISKIGRFFVKSP